MGNFNSTRWNGYRRRDLVEESLPLSITAFSRRGLGENYKFEGDYSGEWMGEFYRLNLGIYPNGQGGLVMDINTLAGGDEPIMLGQTVNLHCTKVFNDKYSRWWFECPMDRGEESWGIRPLCQNRCAVLYLPPGRNRFGCRSCHELVYRANQTHSKRLDWIRKNPQARKDNLMELIESQANDPEHEKFIKKIWSLKLPGAMKPSTPSSDGGSGMSAK